MNTKGKLTSKVSLIVLVVVISAISISLLHWKAQFPYGARRAAMQIMYYALLNYAKDHSGHFPADDKGPYEALSKLYPHYCPTGTELAGLTQDEHDARQRLQAGKSLDETVCSWVYVQGLSLDDDSRIAVLWEKQEGIRSNGRKTDTKSHAVLLINGTITNILGSDWEQFLRMQGELRSGAGVKP